MNWEEGRKKPSLKEDLLTFLRKNDDRAYPVVGLRGHLFPELSWPSDTTSEVGQIELMAIMQRTATIQALLEILVDEGKVEKRAFIVDQIDQVTINEEEYEEVLEQWGDENVEDEKLFYRAATS